MSYNTTLSAAQPPYLARLSSETVQDLARREQTNIMLPVRTATLPRTRPKTSWTSGREEGGLRCRRAGPTGMPHGDSSRRSAPEALGLRFSPPTACHTGTARVGGESASLAASGLPHGGTTGARADSCLNPRPRPPPGRPPPPDSKESRRSQTPRATGVGLRVAERTDPVLEEESLSSALATSSAGSGGARPSGKHCLQRASIRSSAGRTSP